MVFSMYVEGMLTFTSAPEFEDEGISSYGIVERDGNHGESLPP